MLRKALRLLLFAALGGVGAWCARLLAHSKAPPPEGHWREVTEETLSS